MRFNSEGSDLEKSQYITPRNNEEIGSIRDNKRTSVKRVTFQKNNTINKNEFLEELREDLMT